MSGMNLAQASQLAPSMFIAQDPQTPSRQERVLAESLERGVVASVATVLPSWRGDEVFAIGPTCKHYDAAFE